MRNLFAAIVLLAMIANACGSSESTKYKQTWTKAYSTTTCIDWADQMDTHQKFVMAADMLLTLQRKDKSNATLPDDALVAQFQGYISGVCLRADAGTMTISEVAALGYLSSNDYKP